MDNSFRNRLRARVFAWRHGCRPLWGGPYGRMVICIVDIDGKEHARKGFPVELDGEEWAIIDTASRFDQLWRSHTPSLGLVRHVSGLSYELPEGR